MLCSRIETPLLTIVDVVKVLMGIMWVIYHQWSAQAIAILGHEVAVVPERARLIRDSEVVEERVPRSNRALVHESRPVRPVCPFLVDAVPMLHMTLDIE